VQLGGILPWQKLFVSLSSISPPKAVYHRTSGDRISPFNRVNKKWYFFIFLKHLRFASIHQSCCIEMKQIAVSELSQRLHLRMVRLGSECLSWLSVCNLTYTLWSGAILRMLNYGESVNSAIAESSGKRNSESMQTKSVSFVINRNVTNVEVPCCACISLTQGNFSRSVGSGVHTAIP
jgi:hypothetical protein